MKLEIPELSLVVLVGVSGSGKSTFARRHFKATEILSSDFCRGLVADDENDQRATTAAFNVLHTILRERLKAGRLTVIDATNVQPEARAPLVAIAREHHLLPVAVVVDVDERVAHARNAARADRQLGAHVVRMQSSQLRRSVRNLREEGFRHVYRLLSVEDVDAAVVERVPLWNNLKHLRGPFDIVGDVHGCREECERLLTLLGYDPTTLTHPQGRTAVFVGDLVDRGPDSPGVLRLVMRMVKQGSALCVPGNHEMKLLKLLQGKKVTLKHGLEKTAQQLEGETAEFKADVVAFVDGLVSHVVLDGGALVVAHAGLKEDMHGRGSGAVREFCLYGETTGETDAFGLPVRYNWAADYRGAATVVYGHTPVPVATWLNRTLCVDTGCVFGGKLTALRWPEKQIVSVDAVREHYPPSKPLAAPPRADDTLDISDVQGKLIVNTRFGRNITVREEHGAAALEVMSRFAVDPAWLVYLPPTMSPVETCESGAPWLEHPQQAFAYFRDEGVSDVIVEEKHMGSRAVVVVCQDDGVAARRFGAVEGAGVVVTRTGRAFFKDRAIEAQLLQRVRDAVERAGLWRELQTDWLVLDCELMPWSVKAQELLKTQYARVGAAATAALQAVVDVAAATPLADGLRARFEQRQENARAFNDAWARYCWDVGSVDDLRLAPFCVLASEGAVHDDKDHLWHLSLIARLVDPVIQQTRHLVVSLASSPGDDDDAVARCVQWWQALTQAGGEGVVVKPLRFRVDGARGVVQPGLKVRGRDYLRLIYGMDYTLPENLERLRRRAVGAKRSLAQREFLLGLEGLHRFVEHCGRHAVHACVFGVLALESEPVDPTL